MFVFIQEYVKKEGAHVCFHTRICKIKEGAHVCFHTRICDRARENLP